MKRLEYKVSLTTPAFIGNVAQESQWRTPPFKALLRQWWRMVWASQNNYSLDVEKLHKCERLLFGSASGNNTSQKSQVLIRLSSWSNKTLSKPIEKSKYLLYGRDEHSPLQAESLNKLFLALPEKYESEVLKTLSLINSYGTIGGRSRNGWGSIMLEPVNGSPQLEKLNSHNFLRNWEEALECDWAHAIGKDDKGALVWHTENLYGDWEEVMAVFSNLRKEINKSNANHRHWLSQPVKDLKNMRLPNALRFKVREVGKDESTKSYKGVVFCTPHLPINTFKPSKSEILEVWEKVFAELDHKTHAKLMRKQ